MDIGILIVSSIIFVIAVILYWRVYKHEEEITSKVVEDWRKELYKEVDDIRQEKDELLDSYYTIIQRLEDTIELDQIRAKEAHESTEALLAAEHERARAELEGIKALEEEKLKNEFKEKREIYQVDYEKFISSLQEQIDNKQSELNQFCAIYAATIEELRKEEERAHEIEFHSIQLSADAKSDINYLLSIENNIHNKELLHKLIWSEYIQRPFTQMLKNISGAGSPKNVIYCIEHKDNHKKYIGKTSGEISKRWTEHLKSSLGIGTISHQNIHDALFGHWDEFTFWILEEVKEGNLNDREKYYINFFQTDKYGFNIKRGG